MKDECKEANDFDAQKDDLRIRSTEERPGGDGEEMKELQQRILRIDISLETVGWR
jgi:hypothetical protein